MEITISSYVLRRRNEMECCKYFFSTQYLQYELKMSHAYKILIYRKDTKNFPGPPAHALSWGVESPGTTPPTPLPPARPQSGAWDSQELSTQGAGRGRRLRKHLRAAVSCAGSSWFCLAVTLGSLPPPLQWWWALPVGVSASARPVTCRGCAEGHCGPRRSGATGSGPPGRHVSSGRSLSLPDRR